MINKENEVVTRIADVLNGIAEVTSVYVNEPNSFPHVRIEQADSVPVYDDGALYEKFARLMFEINIFSNKQTNRKSECMDIADRIDTEMRRMNFRRTALTPVKNSTQTTVYGTDVHDETVYRLALRYEGVASETHFYRR